MKRESDGFIKSNEILVNLIDWTIGQHIMPTCTNKSTIPPFCKLVKRDLKS